MPVDARKLEQVKQLLEKAWHAATPENEAIVCAWAAVRLMRKLNLTVAHPQELLDQARRAPAQRSSPKANGEKPSWRLIRAKFGGPCRHCLGFIAPGDICMWMRDFGAMHPDCHKEHKACG